jgi:hypothetical protein
MVLCSDLNKKEILYIEFCTEQNLSTFDHLPSTI